MSGATKAYGMMAWTRVNDPGGAERPCPSAEFVSATGVRVPSANTRCGRSRLFSCNAVPSVRFTMLVYATPVYIHPNPSAEKACVPTNAPFTPPTMCGPSKLWSSACQLSFSSWYRYGSSASGLELMNELVAFDPGMLWVHPLMFAQSAA